MGVRIDVALWIYREHFAALALVGVLAGAGRVLAHSLFGAHGSPLVWLTSLATLLVTMSIVRCIAHGDPPRLLGVMRGLLGAVWAPRIVLRLAWRRGRTARAHLLVMALAALALPALVRQGVATLAVVMADAPLDGWPETLRLWAMSLSTGLLEPVLYVAASLALLDPEA